MTDLGEISRTPVRTQADLERLWRTLMGPLGFSRGTLWLMLIDADDLPVPQLMPIEDDGAPPTPDQMVPLAELLAGISAAEPERADGHTSRWAVLRSRPGAGGPSEADRALVAALVAVCRVRRVPLDVVHLATDDTLVPLTGDDLAQSA